MSKLTPAIIADRVDHDVVVVGASLAGCTVALLLARQGLRVAVIEQRADPAAFKRVCTHYIQSSAVPTLERLDLLDSIVAAGGVRSRTRVWTHWGWMAPPADTKLPENVNLRRELLDPLIRSAAAEQDGVELILGHTVDRVLERDGAVAGVEAVAPDGSRLPITARLTIGADGRHSTVARLAGVRTRSKEIGRFAYGGYYDGPPVGTAPDITMWLLDPQWAAVLPTNAGLMTYACMPTLDRLPEFRRDPEAALRTYFADLPNPPPIRESRLVEPLIGALKIPTMHRTTTAPGLALAGDAAMASDPLWGVGCGWALQTGEWLADSVGPALRGEQELGRGLARYARVHRRSLRQHSLLIDSYSTGRRMNIGERTMFSAATRDPRLGELSAWFGARHVKPTALLAPGVLARGAAANLRHAVGRSRVADPALAPAGLGPTG
ncbi:MAG TPA: NAD(P)/FAD-dependent oxidoreductase [Solirubrobacteraceae bacterium]|jgi:2-polyprenyl-6-methoxyphenol hydroxylase-like FAD-dependent oxidoreductase|nr:NAD(P)/FAD-dependent oxidoreductase [Solirubrobacteraceae bacterium]